jgi:hypothetical protein
MRRGIGGHHSAEGRSNTWLTPPWILDRLGPFDLDPCAAPDPRPWPTAAEHWTSDGLTRPWSGRVWLNPPYGSDLGNWMARMARHRNGVALIFARTDTEAFHRYVWPVATALLFLRGRLHFHHPDGRRADANAGAPSVLIAYTERDAAVLRRIRHGAFVTNVKTDVAPMFATEVVA